MRLLLDECLPHRLRLHLPGHDAFTVVYQGWAGVKNGDLLDLAAAGGFDAFITTDRNLTYQQNLGALPVAVVVLESSGIRLEDLLPLVPKLLNALNSLTPRAVTRVTS